MATAWSFHLLGTVAATHGGDSVDLAGPTARAVLAALLLAAGRSRTTEQLIEEVWDGPGEVTHDSVYHYLKVIRAALAGAGSGATVVNRSPGYRLVVEDDAVDWRRFQQLVARGRKALGGGDPAGAARLLTDAVRLWDGPPLDGIGKRLGRARKAMFEQKLAVLEDLAAVELSIGRPERVVELLGDALVHAPSRERMAALLVEALAVTGRRDRAGEVYQRTRAYLTNELGLDPGGMLARAHRLVLDGETPGPPRVQAPRRAGAPREAPSTTEMAAPSDQEQPPAEPPGTPDGTGPVSSWLPPVDSHFSGREDELREALRIDAPGGSRMCTVFGMAGVGKTTLALRAAAQLAASYPDGTVFIEFFGYAADRRPLDPGEAVEVALRRLGVAGERIPTDPYQGAALFQSLLRSRKVLFVFDDVRETRQIRPLLPPAPGCGVLVTSRRRLASLDEAAALPLDVLPVSDAVSAFRSLAGPARLDTDPSNAGPVLADVVARCGRLPLAIRIAAARYRLSPTTTLADLAGQLRDARSALTALDDGERSVVAAFQVSVADLPDELRSALGTLTGPPGRDIDEFVAAAALGTDPAVASWHLDQLVDRQLLARHRGGRYRFHDLVRAFAESRLRSADDWRAVLRRVADYYLMAAERADLVITPQRYRVPLEIAAPPRALPSFADYEAAFAWLDVEQANIAEVCRACGEHGLDTSCWQLAYTMRGYYFLAKAWSAWLATHHSAVAAAHRLGDLDAEANSRNNLGMAHLERGDTDAARQQYRAAFDLFARTGNEHGMWTSRANDAWTLFGSHEYEAFLAEIEPVLAFYRRSGAERNMAITLRGMGLAQAALGRTDEAVSHLDEALSAFGSLGSRLDTAMSWNGLGDAHLRAGGTEQAVRAYGRAVEASEACGSRFEWARARQGLGRAALARGDREEAREHLLAALEVYRGLDAPEAAAIGDLLAEAGSGG